MQIIFINYAPYMITSGVHIHFLANEMFDMGHEVTVVVPECVDNDQFGQQKYEFIDYNSFMSNVDSGKYSKSTILHGWNPKENVRKIIVEASKKLSCGYFVHLEDNERCMIERVMNMPFSEIQELVRQNKLQLSDGVIDPILHEIFLAEAKGVSMLMDTLAEFVPDSVPKTVFWPGCESAFFGLSQTRNMHLRHQYNIDDETYVIVFPGKINPANAENIIPLYYALPLIESKGYKVICIRCSGRDYLKSEEIDVIREKYIRYFPDSMPKDLPIFLKMADILVQPGQLDNFDNYRLPSKLPLFFASGRPVILARTNIGRFLEHDLNCKILKENSAENIAEEVIDLIENPDKAKNIGSEGRNFAKKNFNWNIAAKKLLEMYK